MSDSKEQQAKSSEDTNGTRTLILVRHAKSSWGDIGLADQERPLNERGKKDAPEMAKRLTKKGIEIDLLLSSPAKRARKTAKYFAEEFGVKKEEIKIEEDLYPADPSAIENVISLVSNKYRSIALFAHNPGITYYANSLTDVRIDDLPTCAVFAVQAEANSWQDFKLAEKKFLFLDYPKNPLAQLD
jgi:phosphohistidine phosphatase